MSFNTAEDAIYFLGKQMLQPEGRDFYLSDYRRKVYEYVYYTLAGDAALVPFSLDGPQNAKEAKVNPKKGIILVGDIGVGKTILFRIMGKLFNNTAAGFKRIDATYIAECVMDEELGKDYVLQTYGRRLHTNLYIDDAGLENYDQKLYGNVVNILKDLLRERAELYTNTSYKTHMSTNVATDYGAKSEKSSLVKLYTQPVYDRLLLMNTVVPWTGPSMRTNKIYNQEEGGTHVQG